ncbi:hypothetical protein [Streptomyces sp. NPDC014805]|uniref:hypothetical protein n=1 Tax=Streptomyces sp. NPDC014805 TaxID=3364919 RepID=UPI0036FFF062
MGIRMLHRRTARAQAQHQVPARADALADLPAPLPPVPPFAADASTGRIPVTRTEALRRRTAALARRLTHRDGTAVSDDTAGSATASGTSRRQVWTELGLSYLALLLSRLPRPHRPTRSVTVFVVPPPPTAAAGGPDGPARPRR